MDYINSSEIMVDLYNTILHTFQGDKQAIFKPQVYFCNYLVNQGYSSPVWEYLIICWLRKEAISIIRRQYVL